MLSFAVYQNGKPAEKVDLAGAYVVGTDDVPLRAELSVKKGVIHCDKRAAGSAGLAVMWDVPDVGRILLETVRVPERDRPYVLQVELARARLMRVVHKIEDWNVAELVPDEDVLQQVEQAREALILALQADSPGQAATLGEKALAIAMNAGDLLTSRRARDLFIQRGQADGFARRCLGATLPVDQNVDTILEHARNSLDFVTIPIVWRDIEPTEQNFNWKDLDALVEALNKEQIPIKGSSLLAFTEDQVPDWLYIWEHDFDTIRDLAFEHVRRVINRYGQYVQAWDVISGIHANNCFTFNFEQLMELTRMAAALTKQLSRRSTTIIELVAPWGEYYARNQRTIPPLLYAEMAVQSQVNFDAFGLKFFFGSAQDGMFYRDMFQISSMLDLYWRAGKPIHITGVQVPSTPVANAAGGEDPWSPERQAAWLEDLVTVAFSKPFVESVSWYGLADGFSRTVPTGGLLDEQLNPKPSMQKLREMHRKIHEPESEHEAA